MFESIKSYHLHKNDYANLQFEMKDMRPYIDKYQEHTYRAHQHSFYQIIKFAGPGRHFVDFEAHDFEEPCFFFLEPGQVHYFCREAANEGTLIHFNEVFLVQEADDSQHFLSYYLFNRFGKPFFPASEAHRPHLEALEKMIRSELDQSQLDQKHMLFHLFQSYLVLLERSKRDHFEESNDPEKEADLRIIFRLRRLLNQNKDKMLSVAELSEMLGVYPKKLNTLTQEYFHKSPGQLLIEQKILEAKRLLTNTKLTIKEIAYRLGFDQATYFSKYFKRYSDVQPKEFRDSLH